MEQYNSGEYKKFWQLRHISLVGNLSYYFIDTEGHEADMEFIKNEVPVKFTGELVRDGSKYVVVTCKVNKRYKDRFEKSLHELKNKMLLLGHTEYQEMCKEVEEIINASK